jgi:septal ring-binding cell division protein DamX
MYRALKNAQNDLHTTLLKFADEVVQVVESKTAPESSNPQGGCCDTQESVSGAIQLLHAKQDVQFRVLNGAINSLNENMAKIVTLLSENRAVINTASTIPSIQPAATSEDLKNIGVTEVSDVSEIDAEQEVEVEVEEDAEQEVEQEEDAEQEVEQEVEQEEEIEVDAEQEEEGLEVEEWTYKGRMFFKDSDNTVYAKDGEEIGDAIGTYDPVKNILKKLPSN